MGDAADRPRPGYDAFVSYARSDAAVVVPLVERLRARGLRLWLDAADIPAGSRWREEIAAGIAESDAVLVLLSPASVSSRECRAEIERAIETSTRMVPVLLAPVDEAAVHAQLFEV